MNEHAKNLRRTRADMLGTDDEAHYLECQRAAAYIERLEAKLTQDPKDARCQLYKATQKWQQEAERCNAEIERLHNICEYARNEIKDQKKEIERLEAQRNAIAGADESARDKYEKRIEQLEAQLVRKDKKIERLVRDRFVVERELEKRR
jgi:chromosome segregation ATPase